MFSITQIPQNASHRAAFAGSVPGVLVHTTQGCLAIDNNASERALQRVATGRKNRHFAGHNAAAENTAPLWTLIASCERRGVNPQRYLIGILVKIGTIPAVELHQFLPDVWLADNTAELLAHEKYPPGFTNGHNSVEFPKTILQFLSRRCSH